MDLQSLIETSETLPKDLFVKYQSSLGFKMKDEEILQIKKLSQNLITAKRQLNYFYVGYIIPQINKEFDLLRLGNDFILNIEIKSSATHKKIVSQMQQNRYYLKSLDRSLHMYVYLSDDDKLYRFDENDELEEAEFERLSKLIVSQDISHVSDIDSLFDPKHFLVSPFNDTDRFLKEKYFLTQQQSEFKKSILKNKLKFNIIEGKAGTGKSLLTYDIAKTLMLEKEVLIIHCGKLNEGHVKLQMENGWKIISSKDYAEVDVIKPDVIIVDECQRFRKSQLDHILSYVKENSTCGIFSLDAEQTLGLWERNYNNKERIVEFSNSEANQCMLSTKIRSNKELHDFVIGISDLGRLKNCTEFKNVSIHYYSDIWSARFFAEAMSNENWQIIDYTGQRYNGEAIQQMQLYSGKNAHEAIGQEFDNVLAILGSAFYYDEANKLRAREKNYYDTEKMFYQAITRARKKIMLVIVDNKQLFSRIMENIRI